MNQKTRTIAISLIVFTGVLIRIIKASRTVFLSRDSYLYIELARYLNENRGFHEIIEKWPDFWVPPIPITGIVLCYQFINNYLYAGIIYNIVLGGIIVFLAYSLSGKIAGTRAALIIATLCATHPTLITYSVMIQRENSAIAFFLAALNSFANIIRKNKCRIDCFLPGIYIGLATLSRVEFIIYFSIIGLFWVNNRKTTITFFLQIVIGCVVSYSIFSCLDINIVKHLTEYL